MYFKEKTSTAIEKASKEGKLLMFEIEDLEREDPLLITETARREAYKNDISLRIEQGVGGFEWATKHETFHYKTSIEILKDAEQRMKEAEERGYEVDFLAFENGIGRIFDAVQDNFFGSKSLLSYLNDSGFNLEKYKSVLEESLPQLAQKYANKSLKKSRRKAKNLRRTRKTKSNEMGKLEKDLLCVAELKNYGVNEDLRISQIRNIAYARGVEFLVCEARKLIKVNREKYERILNRAKQNAQVLGREISKELIEVENYD